MDKADALRGRAAEELQQIQQEGALAFWLPADLRTRASKDIDPGVPDADDSGED